MVHLCFYFAADNQIVELKTSKKIMAGLFFMFVMTVALLSMMSDYAECLTHKTKGTK